jgi:hypothetical protein
VSMERPQTVKTLTSHTLAASFSKLHDVYRRTNTYRSWTIPRVPSVVWVLTSATTACVRPRRMGMGELLALPSLADLLLVS